MRKAAVLGLGAILLSGCALPVPLQVASWALDGISVLVSQKSVTDHGISFVTQRDCAVWRGVTEGEFCRDVEDTDVLVAENAINSSETIEAVETQTLALSTMVPRAGNPVDDRTTQQVRAVPTHALRAAWSDRYKPSVSAPNVAANSHALRAIPAAQPAPQNNPVAVAVVEQPLPMTRARVAPQVVKRVEKPRRLTQDKAMQPTKGIYFVIGSFRNPKNANRLVRTNDSLSPAVLRGRLDGSNIYRVVVGPVPKGREKRLQRALARDGFPDTWAIRVNPSDWRFAKLPKSRSKTIVEVATLHR